MYDCYQVMLTSNSQLSKRRAMPVKGTFDKTSIQVVFLQQSSFYVLLICYPASLGVFHLMPTVTSSIDWPVLLRVQCFLRRPLNEDGLTLHFQNLGTTLTLTNRRVHKYAANLYFYQKKIQLSLNWKETIIVTKGPYDMTAEQASKDGLTKIHFQ